MLHKIVSIKTLPGFRLYTAFSDGTETLYDVSELFNTHPEFQDLKTVSGLFAQAKADNGGYGISWNDELDLDGEELYTNGIRLREAFAISPGCTCPVCGQRIRRKSEAQKAACLANLAKRRSKGGRPINPDSKRQQTLKKKFGRFLAAEI